MRCEDAYREAGGGQRLEQVIEWKSEGCRLAGQILKKPIISGVFNHHHAMRVFPEHMINIMNILFILL